MDFRIKNIKDVKLLVGMIIIFVILFYIQIDNYLLFHVMAELFSIIIAGCVFIIVWNGRSYLKDNYLLLLGLAYLFIGFIDLLHTLGYKGMNIFRNYDFYANQFWIAGRGLESLTLMFGTFLIGRKKLLSINRIMILYMIITVAIIYSILFSDIFPVCFIEGQGQTMFKVISEYVINAILAVSIVLLYRKRTVIAADTYRYIVISIIFTIISELTFTFYVSNYGFSNMLGHFSKIISFYFVYRAVVRKNILEPYDTIFRELSEQREKMREADKLKTRLFSIISHDLSGPVAAVTSVARAMDEDFETISISDKRLFIVEMRKSLDFISTLLENLLAWAKIEMEGHKLYPGSYDPGQLLSDSVDSLKQSFTLKGVNLVIDAGQTDNIEVDPETFRIIIRNVLSNALKFSNSGTTVNVRLSQDAERVTIRCRDEGIGMKFTPDMLQNQVNNSSRGTANEKGTGLGLYMIRKYTEENNGQLKIESSPGKGTEVTLMFNKMSSLSGD